MKIRFIEPGNVPYKPSFKNLYVYDRFIRTPSNGLMTLATIVQKAHPDFDILMYSESISKLKWSDILDSDVVFISIFTFSAMRGYELADFIRENSKSKIVFGGLHATLNHTEVVPHCDFVLLGEGDETILKIIDSIEKGATPDFQGVAYKDEFGKIVCTGRAPLPHNIDCIPNREICHNFKKMAGHNTIWPQVHASRGCPHNCDYCSLVATFGRGIRTRTPQNVIDDIKNAISFFEDGHHRLAKFLWITDDNFFADRKWAMEVLNLMIEQKINYRFSIQARFEVGFDDEMLELLKKAGFFELALGIEFLEDEAFRNYHKKSTYQQILDSVKNIQKHGLNARGLFIFGADNHTKGIGEKLANFVIENGISGILIQSMYFVPGTPVYASHKDELIDENWSRCVGKVVHYPKLMSPTELQNEIIIASKKIYSVKRLAKALFTKKFDEFILFAGEFFWQQSVRNRLKKDMQYLRTHAKSTLRQESFAPMKKDGI
ncbi:MAG: B12-binding domain-containing radical SAM protein [Treponema sp.]|nr:B12-binding domain-containing radical SAM protein [Treponema sp.]